MHNMKHILTPENRVSASYAAELAAEMKKESLHA